MTLLKHCVPSWTEQYHYSQRLISSTTPALFQEIFQPFYTMPSQGYYTVNGNTTDLTFHPSQKRSPTSSTETITSIIFGLCALVVGLITIWQSNKARRTWRAHYSGNTPHGGCGTSTEGTDHDHPHEQSMPTHL